MSANHNLKKILIIRLSSIGDVVLTSHLPRMINNKFAGKGGAEVHFVTSSHIAPLFTNNHHISKVIRYRADVKDRIKQEIENEKYDIVIDLQKNNISSFLISDYKGDLRVIDKHRGEKLKMVYLKKFPKEVTHVAERYLNTCRDLIIDDDKGLDLYLDKEVSDKITVGIAPEAYHNTKRWPKERYAELIDRLTTDGYNVSVFGLNNSNLGNGNQNVTNFSGSLSLVETAKRINECDYFISNDTGLMHIASACQIPIVLIFGSSVKELGFTPYRIDYKLVEYDIWCRPCSHIGRSFCPIGHFKCMNEISVEQVYNSFNNLREK